LPLSAGIPPVGDFFQSFSPGLLEKTDAVAGMLEFVDIGPHFSLPGLIMDVGFAAGGATSVQLPD
jgi:hypothetical protein